MTSSRQKSPRQRHHHNGDHGERRSRHA
jgi:hypothetical protein